MSEEQVEQDELNQHECMLPLMRLLDHMQHNCVTPKVSQVYIYVMYITCMGLLKPSSVRERLCYTLLKMRAKSPKQLSSVCTFFSFGTAHLIFHVRTCTYILMYILHTYNNLPLDLQYLTSVTTHMYNYVNNSHTYKLACMYSSVAGSYFLAIF